MKTTTRRLLTSAIAIVVILALGIGATFAWFTASTASEAISITVETVGGVEITSSSFSNITAISPTAKSTTEAYAAGDINAILADIKVQKLELTFRIVNKGANAVQVSIGTPTSDTGNIGSKLFILLSTSDTAGGTALGAATAMNAAATLHTYNNTSDIEKDDTITVYLLIWLDGVSAVDADMSKSFATTIIVTAS